MVTTRKFIICKVCKKDMEGVMLFEHEDEDFWNEGPNVVCIECYYKEEIKELDEEK